MVANFWCTYKAIKSMSDLVHSWTVCKLFFSKITYPFHPSKVTLMCSELTDLWNTSLLFNLNYKFINGSFAFSPC